MTSVDLSKALWDLANSITAFAALQGLVFVYACAKREIGDLLNKKRLKAAIAIAIVLVSIAQSFAVAWCRSAQCELAVDYCEIYSEANIIRVVCLVGVGVCSILALYARQLFSRKPFDG